MKFPLFMIAALFFFAGSLKAYKAFQWRDSEHPFFSAICVSTMFFMAAIRNTLEYADQQTNMAAVYWCQVMTTCAGLLGLANIIEWQGAKIEEASREAGVKRQQYESMIDEAMKRIAVLEQRLVNESEVNKIKALIDPLAGKGES